MKKYIAKCVEDIDVTKVDAAWDGIEGGVLLDNANAGVAEHRTEFKLAYNKAGDVYFLYDMDDEHPNCTMAGYNNPIYDEETVEFFFATESNLRDYLELEWNIIGGVFAANIDNDLEGHTVLHFIEDNPVISHVIPREGGYYIVGKIKAEAFKGKAEGTWLFNAYRIKRREDNSMILSAYSPTFIEQFHRPNYFVQLEFENID